MFSDPNYVVEQLDLQSGSKVADFGVGSGFYSLALSKAVGDNGKVYAVDVQKGLLETLKNETNRRRAFNVEFVWGDIEKEGGSHLADDSLDAVVIVNVFFQIVEKKKVISEIKRVLKKNGQVLIVDWSESFGGLGPTEESVVSEFEIKKLFEAENFVFYKKVSAGDHHFGIILKKQ